MRWHRYLLFLLVSVSPSAFGADDQALSLDSAVAQALERAPQLSAGTASVDVAQALAMSAGRLPDPALVVGIDNLPVNGPDAYSTTRDFMTMRKIGVMQEFPWGEKRRLQHQRAEAGADLAIAELAQTRLEVAREAARAWIRLATANTSLEELRALQSEIDLSAASARAAVAAGRSSGAEALAAEAAVARLKNRILQMQGEARGAQAELGRWIGEDANRPLASLPAFDQLPVPAAALLKSPHLHAAIVPFEARLASARTDVALARAERRPDWSAELSFAKRGPDFSDMASLQFTVGLPLFAKYRQNPVIAARSAELKRVEADRETEIRMHTAELERMVIGWQQLGEQLKQYQSELVPLARERSRVALASYRAGSSDLKLALDAYQDEINLLIDRAALQNERGHAWAFLRYQEAEHLHP
jgi:outer membrane protein TolC